jgi:hypothetical protein
MADQEKVFTPGGGDAGKMARPPSARPAAGVREGEPLKTKQPMSGCTKLLLGCGCGCVSLLVIAVVAGVAIFWWAIAEKPLDPPEFFIDASAVSVAHLRIDRNNPISKPLIRDLDAEFSKRKEEEVKEWKDVATPADLMERALPIQVTAVSRRGLVSESEKEDILVVIGYARLSNLVNWLWEKVASVQESKSSSNVIRHEGAQIMLVRKVMQVGAGSKSMKVTVTQDKADSYMSCLGANIMVSPDLERLKDAISRQRARTADFGGSKVMKEMFAMLSPSRDAFGIVVNQDDLLAQELAFLQDRGNVIDFSNVDALCWDAKAIGPDKVDGVMRFKCKDIETAAQLTEAVQRAKKDIELTISEEGIKLSLSPSTRGKVSEVKFTLEEFRDNLVESFFED